VEDFTRVNRVQEAAETVNGFDDPSTAHLLSALVHAITDLDHDVREMVKAVKSVNEHQLWTTQQVAGFKANFDHMMAGGGPMKMIAAMMGRGPKNG
jgi:hypothetical protein